MEIAIIAIILQRNNCRVLAKDWKPKNERENIKINIMKTHWNECISNVINNEDTLVTHKNWEDIKIKNTTTTI